MSLKSVFRFLSGNVFRNSVVLKTVLPFLPKNGVTKLVLRLLSKNGVTKSV